MRLKRTEVGKLCAGLCFALFLVLSCAGQSPRPVEAARGILEARVGGPGSAGPVFCRSDKLCGSDVLPEFYRARGFRPAWIDSRLTLEAAESLLPALRAVAEDGLNPENYHLAAIETLLQEVREDKGKKMGDVRPESLADLDMLLTDSFLLCGSHLVHGQVNPETIHSEWFIKGRHEDLVAVLEKGLEENDIPKALDSLRPSHAVYLGLKKAFREQTAISAKGGWPAFPPGPRLKMGESDARVEALRRALAATGDLALSDTVGTEFDAGLEEAVKAFQRRHGLLQDGIVGVATGAALNIPAARRLTQIRANLERWRWITQDLGERYILINAADFRVKVIEREQEVMSMPAIVGTAYRRTPEFSAKLAYVEINPFWNVPPKLAREDILPKVGENPDYLKEKGIRVYESWTEGAPEVDPDSIDWTKIKAEDLTFRFRQDPGPHNALGRIKFIFPNKFDVYIHDTPEKALFSRPSRAFSSGCVRVERPIDLAAYVLRALPEWNSERIKQAMDSPERRVIPLQDALGVHLLYWTAWLDEHNRVHFREDVYGRDAAIFRALEEVAPRPDK